jgi:hypothetical protein
MFRNRFIFYGEGLLVLRPTPKLEDHPCRMSAAAYSMYSQLTSIAGGRPSIRDTRTSHSVVTGTQQTWLDHATLILELPERVRKMTEMARGRHSWAPFLLNTKQVGSL